MRTDRRWRATAHLVVVAVGVLALGWAVLSGDPVVACRGEVMAPGSTCGHASVTGSVGDKVQTYEERLQAARTARPVVGAVGALVAVFGVVLLADDRRRRSAQGDSGIGP